MKKVMVLLFCSILLYTSGGPTLASEQDNDSQNVVTITFNAVRVPLGRILLIRKNADYCAVKFTKFWVENTEDLYAEYESYYQGDKTGIFSNKNVQINKGELSAPRPRGLGRFSFSVGQRVVQCGPIRLKWFEKSGVYFHNEGNTSEGSNMELAPTKWTDIFHVNVLDHKVKWYRYDIKRQDMFIPVDQLW